MFGLGRDSQAEAAEQRTPKPPRNGTNPRLSILHPPKKTPIRPQSHPKALNCRPKTLQTKQETAVKRNNAMPATALGGEGLELLELPAVKLCGLHLSSLM